MSVVLQQLSLIPVAQLIASRPRWVGAWKCSQKFWRWIRQPHPSGGQTKVSRRWIATRLFLLLGSYSTSFLGDVVLIYQNTVAVAVLTPIIIVSQTSLWWIFIVGFSRELFFNFFQKVDKNLGRCRYFEHHNLIHATNSLGHLQSKGRHFSLRTHRHHGQLLAAVKFLTLFENNENKVSWFITRTIYKNYNWWSSPNL